MELKLRNTSKVVELDTGSGTVPARIWEGFTAGGIEVHCYITRVAVALDAGPEVHAAFERELLEQAPPSAEVVAIPNRLIL